jgi:heme exporter protein A
MKLVVRDLAADRGSGNIFENVGFTLGKGEGLLVTGPNGAGKSTLIRVIAGLLRAAGGEAVLEGGGEKWPDVATASHYLGPFNAMKPSLSVVENLTFWQDFQGEATVTIDEALQTVGLAHTRDLPFSYLSTGQRRRISIARLLVTQRPVWLLDEPTSGLDAASEIHFAGLVQAHLAGGGIAVAATHLPLAVDGMKTLTFSGSRAA